jgi:RhoGAP domain
MLREEQEQQNAQLSKRMIRMNVHLKGANSVKLESAWTETMAQLKQRVVNSAVATCKGKKAAKLRRQLGECELWLGDGIFCVGSRTVGSYRFDESAIAELALKVKKKRALKQVYVQFDGSKHVVGFVPDVTTAHGVIRALPKLDARDYANYALWFQVARSKKAGAASSSSSSFRKFTESLCLSTVNVRQHDVLYYAPQSDLPDQSGDKSIDQEKQKPTERERERQKEEEEGEEEKEEKEEERQQPANEVPKPAERESDAVAQQRAHMPNDDEEEIDEEALRALIHGAIKGKKGAKSAKKKMAKMLKESEPELPATRKRSGSSAASSNDDSSSAHDRARSATVAALMKNAKFGKSDADASSSSSSSSKQLPVALEIVQCFVDLLRRYDAVQTKGIFRVSGITECRDRLLQMLRCGNLDAQPEDGTYSVHDVSSAFKSYLRSAPEPVVPFSHYEPLLDALDDDDNDDGDEKCRAVRMAKCIASMPLEHRNSLLCILSFCAEVRANEQSNMMSAGNLAVVFSPTIMWERPAAAQSAQQGGAFTMSSAAAMLSAAGGGRSASQQEVVELLITEIDTIVSLVRIEQPVELTAALADAFELDFVDAAMPPMLTLDGDDASDSRRVTVHVSAVAPRTWTPGDAAEALEHSVQWFAIGSSSAAAPLLASVHLMHWGGGGGSSNSTVHVATLGCDIEGNRWQAASLSSSNWQLSLGALEAPDRFFVMVELGADSDAYGVSSFFRVSLSDERVDQVRRRMPARMLNSLAAGQLNASAEQVQLKQLLASDNYEALEHLSRTQLIRIVRNLFEQLN